MSKLRDWMDKVQQDSAAAEASGIQSQAATQAQGIMNQQFDTMPARLTDAYNQVQPMRQPFIGAGMGAAGTQAAQSGAMGQPAQAAAFQNYQESPGVQFMRDQGMRGMEQNLAASGVGGGTRLKALSRFNQGLALQDYGNQFNRLGQVADRGVGQMNLGANERFGLAQGINDIGSQQAMMQAATTQGLGDINVDRLMSQAANQQSYSDKRAASGGVLGNIAKYAAPVVGMATQGFSLYNQANKWL